jgi:5-oxoprolinase (ATP-hydrolysing)
MFKVDPMSWQFWLDVGGTFTDCLARTPEGDLRRRKVLSSGVVKGTAAVGSTVDVVMDAARSEPAGFWNGYGLSIVDSQGRVAAVTQVTDSDGKNSRFSLGSLRPRPGTTLPNLTTLAGWDYELVSPEEAPILAIRLFLGLRLDEPLPKCGVRLGTTRGTNALLTRRGAETALVTTRGFADVLRIGYQNRPKLFELNISKPEPLYSAVCEIEERIAADGQVLAPASDLQIRAALAGLKSSGSESLAICLLNSYANARHEEQVERIARELGFKEISVSSRVSPLMKIVPRGDTTVVDAYLNPVLRSYVEHLTASLPDSDIRLMTSAGGLASSRQFSGKDSILSGPAGGVIGFSRAAEAAGFAQAIGFDMGGTSTDVARYGGRFEYEYETEKAGTRIVAPMLSIETVAAGGGSICKFDGSKLVVGPESAGAEPGPACYGRGGPLTITDCNLALGRVVPEHFPFPLDRKAVELRLEEVVFGARSERSKLELAAGFVRIANANMAQAIRSISLAKGYDPRDYVLVAFGAAGPQHACAVAHEIGIKSVLIHPDASVLSALGMGLADVVKHRTAGLYRSLEDCTESLAASFAELEERARLDVRAEGLPASSMEVRRSLELRYRGADASLIVLEPPDGDYAAAFAAEHRRRYGYTHENRPQEVVAARVEVVGRTDTRLPASHALPAITIEPHGIHTLFLDSHFQTAALYYRDRLLPGVQFDGPAVIVEPLTTTIVDPGWHAALLSGGELLLTVNSPATPAAATPHSTLRVLHSASSPDPVLLEVYSNHFTAIATQMGITLRNTSLSVNVKERLDFSCAIFTAGGDLVVNAPHIPVHLGAMAETVKHILADNPAMQHGDVFVTNDPYRGGSHLPDVTVVTPVFNVAGTLRVPCSGGNGTRNAPPTELLFFTASRAHHAEIGGITPGSMPPFSKNLAEEGVLIRNLQLLAAGAARFDELRALLSSGPHPSRAVEANVADLTAQVAANQQGAADLQRMVKEYTWPVVRAYMRYIQDAAEQKLRGALARLPPGRREFVDHLDDGTPICVAITVSGDTAIIDFTGTGPVSTGNLNANRSIVTAAVLYVLRLLVGEEVPLNQGLLAPVEIVLPECLLNPPAGNRPEDCPAVVGGNVETSQRVVDVLLGAFGLAAASQGTMNNLLFGDATFGYYETICGGSGATAAAAGADAVHTHLTNTRITDPEVLEARYPVRLREFSIRRGSGGAGQHRGGDGVVRRIEFLRPLTLSMLSQRRGAYPPYGAGGGQPGAMGRNSMVRADGSQQLLGGLVQTEVQAGDVLTIETPGGGGWGAAQARNPKHEIRNKHE